MTSSSHSGVTTDDRAYLVQQVAALTGLAAADSEKRVDALIAESKTAIKSQAKTRMTASTKAMMLANSSKQFRAALCTFCTVFAWKSKIKRPKGARRKDRCLTAA